MSRGLGDVYKRQPVDIAIDALARGVAPRAAYEWWTSFEEGEVAHGRVRSRRRVLERAPGRVVMEDRTVGLPFRERLEARLDPEALEVRFEGANTVSRFAGAYRFQADPAGARVRLDATVTLRAALVWATPLARPLARALLRHDLEGHVEEMRRDVLRLSLIHI